MSGQAAKVTLTEKTQQILTRLSNASTAKKNVALRASIILLAANGLKNSTIADLVSVGPHCIGMWRQRWQASLEALIHIECNESAAVLQRAVEDTLGDAPRSGRPRTFLDEQVAQIVALACRSPRELGCPVNCWTGRELAEAAVKHGIVASISTARVNDILRMVDLKPQHLKGWCFTTEKDDELFRMQMTEVCDVYLNAPKRYEQSGTYTVCVDEMTSLQANQKRAPSKPPLPSQEGKQECQYTRHGTLSLTGSWDVVAGQMINTTIEKSRTAEDFAKHIAETIAAAPNGEWVFVMDNLNTHYGEPIVRMIAGELGIDASTLGDKEKRIGILGSVATRKEFLTDLSHRIRFVFIPKHSSWLNQIETIFGIISRRVMRNGNFPSVQDLKDKLRTFVEYFNRTFARLISWKFDGKRKPVSKRKRPDTWREARLPGTTARLQALVAP